LVCDRGNERGSIEEGSNKEDRTAYPPRWGGKQGIPFYLRKKKFSKTGEEEREEGLRNE